MVRASSKSVRRESPCSLGRLVSAHSPRPAGLLQTAQTVPTSRAGSAWLRGPTLREARVTSRLVFLTRWNQLGGEGRAAVEQGAAVQPAGRRRAGHVGRRNRAHHHPSVLHRRGLRQPTQGARHGATWAPRRGDGAARAAQPSPANVRRQRSAFPSAHRARLPCGRARSSPATSWR